MGRGTVSEQCNFAPQIILDELEAGVALYSQRGKPWRGWILSEPASRRAMLERVLASKIKATSEIHVRWASNFHGVYI